MTGWVALLRAVNVGGTGKLPMAELKALCEGLGFDGVRTYIASGNVVFASKLNEAEVRGAIEAALVRHCGAPIAVLVRSAAEMAGVAERNPWPDMPGNRIAALFTDEPPTLEGVRHQADELIVSGSRELYAYYPGGMGNSRLVLPAARTGTARNLNTVRKLAEMAGAI